jgi:hypothetical protein
LNRQDIFWEGHRVGQRKSYRHMEQLTNLGALPAHGFSYWQGRKLRLREPAMTEFCGPAACSMA